MADTTEQPRDGNNKFLYDNAAVQRDAEAARLKSDGLTYQEIADALGYSDRGNAWRGVQRAKRAILREPAEELIQVESGRLDELYVEALAVLERDHVMVANGKIVCDEDGSPSAMTGQSSQRCGNCVRSASRTESSTAWTPRPR